MVNLKSLMKKKNKKPLVPLKHSVPRAQHRWQINVASVWENFDVMLQERSRSGDTYLNLPIKSDSTDSIIGYLINLVDLWRGVHQVFHLLKSGRCLSYRQSFLGDVVPVEFSNVHVNLVPKKLDDDVMIVAKGCATFPDP